MDKKGDYTVSDYCHFKQPTGVEILSGTQSIDTHQLTENRFPSGGESIIHKAFRVTRLGARELCQEGAFEI